MLTITGDTIYYDGKAVAWLTVPPGTLRAQVEQALSDLPDVAPLRQALTYHGEAETLSQPATTAEHVVKTLEVWLDDNQDTLTETLI